MSKAKIVEHLGKGKYRVKLQIDIRAIKAQIEALTERIEQASKNINNQLQKDVDTAKEKLAAVFEQQTLAQQLDELVSSNKKIKSDHDKAVADLVSEQGLKEQAEKRIIDLQKTADEKFAAIAAATSEAARLSAVAASDAAADAVSFERQWLEQIDRRIFSELQPALDSKLAALNNSNAAIAAIKAELNSISSQHNLGAPGTGLAQWLSKLVEARSAYDKALKALIREKLSRENAIDEKGKLGAYKEEEVRDIWCADYTTDLKPDTEVGVIDWYQLRGKSTPGKQTILPGYLTGKDCKYNKVRDGRRVPQGGLSTYSWWYAMMLCSGMERLNPHYRKGEISAINDNGRVDVTVDETYTQALHSEAKALSAKELSLTNVPVRYLSCDSAVFEVGDRVVLEYPRKNIHQDLAKQYESARLALEAKTDALHAKIVGIESQIAAQQQALDSQLSDAVAKRMALSTADPIVIDQLKFDLHQLELSSAEIDRSLGKLKAKKLGFEIFITSSEAEIIKLRNLESEQNGYYESLKAYTDTRPKEITVIGFVENPRPYEGLAFKNSAGKWMVVTPDGKERGLNNPPALVGDFNWGIQNEDGRYDCACVWFGTEIRTGGYTYNLGVNIGVAGVIKDMPNKGQFTIKATDKYSNKIITVVVSDGVINAKTTANVTGGASVVITNSTASAGNFIYEVSNDILVDASGKFAIVAHYQSTTLTTSSGEIVTLAHLASPVATNISSIYRVDLITFDSTLLSKHTHTGTSWSSPVFVANESLQYSDHYYGSGGAIIDGSIRYEHNSLAYGVDNEIMMSALIEANVDFHAGATYTYAVVGFKNGVINKKHPLYINKQPMQSGLPGFVLNTNKLLCTIIDNESIYPIMINNHHVTEIPATDDLILPYGTVSLGSSDTVPAGAFGDVEVTTTRLRSKGDFAGATVRGFSAGCVKIKSRHAVNMWLEYRGAGYKIVNAPSTDYTILI